MSDKYFSQLNGYKVKDAEARESIETLSKVAVQKNPRTNAAQIATLADDHKDARDTDIVNRKYVTTKLANINTGGGSTTGGSGTTLYIHKIILGDYHEGEEVYLISTRADRYYILYNEETEELEGNIDNVHAEIVNVIISDGYEGYYATNYSIYDSSDTQWELSINYFVDNTRTNLTIIDDEGVESRHIESYTISKLN